MTKPLPCTDDKDKIEKNDYTQNPISAEPRDHHKNKTDRLSDTPLSPLIARPAQSRFLADLPPEMVCMIGQYLEPNDVRNFQHTSREFRKKLSGLNKHIIVENTSALLDALDFFSRRKHHKLKFKITKSNADNANERLLLERSPHINWSELHSEKSDTASTSTYTVKELDLSDTNIDDQSLAIILAHAPLLTSLSLGDCKKLSKDVLLSLLKPELLKKLAGLESLDLSYTNIDVESLINVLKHLPKLVSINLSGCNIDDQNLAIILEHVSLLTFLSLSGCKKLSKGVLLSLLKSELLKKLAGLESLDLSYTNIDVESLITVLEHLPKLVSINLSRCKIPSLSTLKKLKDSGVLKNFEKLQSLILSETEIGEKELEIILAHTPKLISLDGSYTELNENILEVIQQYTPKLIFLNLGGCTNIFFNIFPIEKDPPYFLQNIRILDLSETKLSYQGLAIILIGAPNLISFKLNWFQASSDDDEYEDFIDEKSVDEAFTKDEFIKKMTSTQAAKLQNLDSLDLQNSTIDDESLIAILEHATNLRFLNLQNCEDLSEDLFFKMEMSMLNRLKSLKELNLNGTQVNYQDLEAAIEEFIDDAESSNPTAQE